MNPHPFSVCVGRTYARLYVTVIMLMMSQWYARRFLRCVCVEDTSEISMNCTLCCKYPLITCGVSCTGWGAYKPCVVGGTDLKQSCLLSGPVAPSIPPYGVHRMRRIGTGALAYAPPLKAETPSTPRQSVQQLPT